MPEETETRKGKVPQFDDVREKIAEDLAARIRSGGNISENLERWAHDQDPDIAARKAYAMEKDRKAREAAEQERAEFEAFKAARAKKGAK